MTIFKLCRLAVLILSLGCSVAAGQVRDATNTGQGGIFDLLPAEATTRHSLATPSGDLPYTTTVGTIDLYDTSGTFSAKIVYTAHVMDDAPQDRPITFAFNGGPGAGSAYLQMGLAGPRIVELDASGGQGRTPVLQDNPDSWLAFTDLVFLDPVGTGWSRAASDEAARGFYSVAADAQAMARAIALYVEKAGRLSSPKYLMGESYGGFRSARVAMELRERQGLLLSGIVMVSPFLEGRHLVSTADDPLSAALQLPSLAAAELERQGAFTPEALAVAERFAMSEYLVGLADPPTGAEADAFYARIADLTGISP